MHFSGLPTVKIGNLSPSVTRDTHKIATVEDLPVLASLDCAGVCGPLYYLGQGLQGSARVHNPFSTVRVLSSRPTGSVLPHLWRWGLEIYIVFSQDIESLAWQTIRIKL